MSIVKLHMLYSCYDCVKTVQIVDENANHLSDSFVHGCVDGFGDTCPICEGDDCRIDIIREMEGQPLEVMRVSRKVEDGRTSLEILRQGGHFKDDEDAEEAIINDESGWTYEHDRT